MKSIAFPGVLFGCIAFCLSRAMAGDIQPLPEKSVYESFGRIEFDSLLKLYDFDTYVQSGATEYDKQRLLMEWVFNKIRMYGSQQYEKPNTLEILRLNDSDPSAMFYCMGFAMVYIQCSQALGWNAREVSSKRSTGGEHSSVEIWSNVWRKWVLMDPLYCISVEKENIPLTTYEVRMEYYRNKGDDLVFMAGNNLKQFNKTDWPITFDKLPAMLQNKGSIYREDNASVNGENYSFHFFHTALSGNNAYWETKEYNWSSYYLITDQINQNSPWTSAFTKIYDPKRVYWSLNKTIVTVDSSTHPNRKISLAHQDSFSFTPNFGAFYKRVDGGTWSETPASLTWSIHGGNNTLEVKSVNKFNVDGMVTVLSYPNTTEIGVPACRHSKPHSLHTTDFFRSVSLTPFLSRSADNNITIHDVSGRRITPAETNKQGLYLIRNNALHSAYTVIIIR
jgi:hypothetical protein